ncbi:ligase-associated DNA damage response endonuclease PdeM [Pseudomonas sp. gcc21]|uniref:ligase-associated DNA damage response endonuclease PdeM n=1 Tax=Pseudomonas sp. gcc21 TaxID=2726989 RepID=UPI001452092F|nr:ligase-associated DNA damage response endonuclease PdeM [Pseudomonas sp. gcc21]QJD59767.1 ligase-associated DNA damage response endonuclease PdeM [Pseudomonas sp. gcc21]
MSRTLDWQLAGEKVVLHGDKALYYPAHATLMVADTHFGKGAFFRRKGLAVPTGQSQDDLQRLTALIQYFRPKRLIVLGDFFHHRPREGEPFLEQFPLWLKRHADVQVEAVIGNHDRHAEGIDIGITWHATLDLGPFRLCHEPISVPGKHILAGHLHPAYTLTVGRDKLRAPVFWFREGVTVLPSFGALTGGWDIKPDPAEDAVLVVDGELFRLSGGM